MINEEQNEFDAKTITQVTSVPLLRNVVTIQNKMSNIEYNNNNMKVNGLTNKIEDIERGKSGQRRSSIPWVKIIIMIVAAAVWAAATAAVWVCVSWQIGLVVFAVILYLYLTIYFWRWLWIAARTVTRDFKALYCYIKILRLSNKFTKKNWSMPDIFHDVVKRHPMKPCFLFEDEVWTFQQVEEYSLRVSAVLRAQGVSRGDTVAVMASNYPELPAIWLGITRIGGIAPLINTNQTGNTLLHSINIAKCQYVIYGSEYDSAFQDIKSDISSNIKIFKFTRRPLNTGDGVKVAESQYDLTHLLETTPPAPWSLSEGEGFLGRLLYIYTSGTTGLPKAAVISPSRMVFMASGVHFLGGLNRKDVVYCPMPLYHSAGGVITMGQAFIFGCTVALRLKFSASAYFPDCIKYKATAAHYIGEMCRYVLATPPSANDRKHTVRVVYGNGMRPAIWMDFVNRFGIKRVSEFYGATEGNANIVNIDSKPGAIGFISRIIPAVYPIAIIKVDEDTGEPIRDSRGLCQIAKPYEPGVFIGKIKPNNPSRAFLGYVDKEASDKKIVKDVLTHGDSAFISGDILVADDLGYLYFRDRTGDTFRWRGENVSTTEVESAISRVADQRDAVVYGVEIPNTEGRAGMCGIVDSDGSLDLEKLAKDISKDLPKYARPIFIRIMDSMDMTATFKIRKVDLQKEGYNPNTVTDKIYYFDPKLNKYVTLGPNEYEKIISGEIRL